MGIGSLYALECALRSRIRAIVDADSTEAIGELDFNSSVLKLNSDDIQGSFPLRIFGYTHDGSSSPLSNENEFQSFCWVVHHIIAMPYPVDGTK